MFIWLLFCTATLLAQNASSSCIGKRNIDEGLVGQAVLFPSSPLVYAELDIPPLLDASIDFPSGYYHEPHYYPMPHHPEIVPCATVVPECVKPATSTPSLGAFADIDIAGLVEAEAGIGLTPAPSEVPLITAVGFGCDAVSMALSPLMEAADADVALLMFTKVKVI